VVSGKRQEAGFSQEVTEAREVHLTLCSLCFLLLNRFVRSSVLCLLSSVL
jgi:hypothetical protein